MPLRHFKHPKDFPPGPTLSDIGKFWELGPAGLEALSRRRREKFWDSKLHMPKIDQQPALKAQL